MKIAPLAGAAWSADILNGQRPFPTFNRKGGGEGFKEILEKEMEKEEKNEQS